MDVFREDGHLTDEALTALTQASPEGLARLEIAEHLAFCDLCLERYTAMLAGTAVHQAFGTPPQEQSGELYFEDRAAKRIPFGTYYRFRR